MRFALLGDHADGLAMTRALVESGRHELAAYSGPAVGGEYLRRWDLDPPRALDPEEVLANSAIPAVIVAVSPANRPALLRRSLQSDKHVLCVHPPDHRPDTAYEAAMIQAETRRVLVPLLPDTLHPGIRRLRLSPIRLLELERWSPEPIVLDSGIPGHKPAVPGWDVLRLLGGEIVEVMALAASEELAADEPLLLTGRFQQGALFRVTFLPKQAHERWRLALVTASSSAELTFPDGWPGAAHLSYADETGAARTESFDAWNPWPALVEAFERALEGDVRGRAAAAAIPASIAASSTNITVKPAGESARLRGPAVTSHPLIFPTWQDAIRCLELDDAARRSVERRRASTLEYQQASEEASFKGTMTLVGCGLVWISLVLLILSAWLPWLGWFIIPVFALFLILQILRWVVPKPGSEQSSAPATRAVDADQLEADRQAGAEQSGKLLRSLAALLRRIVGGG